jgi:hypothetical protein
VSYIESDDIHLRWVKFPKDRTGWFRVDTLLGNTWYNEEWSYDEIVGLIARVTQGNFFFDDRAVYFDKEKDAVIFKLMYTNDTQQKV